MWTPPGYDENRAEPYPVLYLLQDDAQSYREWVELGRLKQILDNLTVDGDIEPMVVVMGDGDSGDARAERAGEPPPCSRGRVQHLGRTGRSRDRRNRSWRIAGTRAAPDCSR